MSFSRVDRLHGAQDGEHPVFAVVHCRHHALYAVFGGGVVQGEAEGVLEGGFVEGAGGLQGGVAEAAAGQLVDLVVDDGLGIVGQQVRDVGLFDVNGPAPLDSLRPAVAGLPAAAGPVLLPLRCRLIVRRNRYYFWSIRP